MVALFLSKREDIFIMEYSRKEKQYPSKISLQKLIKISTLTYEVIFVIWP